MSGFDLYHYLDFGTKAEYERLEFPSPKITGDRIGVAAEGLESLARVAFSNIAYFYPKGHLEKLAAILEDDKASNSEKFVAGILLQNAVISAEGLFPMCQDTGTALVYGWKAHNVDSGGKDSERLSRGLSEAYKTCGLRASQMGPLSFAEEKNTGNNLPAHLDIRATDSGGFRFLFAAKGGGSTSRTNLSMESPAILAGNALERTLAARIQALGAAGCPPYTIAAVLGGVTPSHALYALELAVYGLLDTLPEYPREPGAPLRSRAWEKTAEKLAVQTGIGAQWGGSHLALETRMIRLSRHAANLPLAVGVSCAAHRKARAIVDEEGWFLEKMETDPARLLPPQTPLLEGAVEIDLDAPKEIWLEKLRALPVGARVTLSGSVTVARDKAHARIAAAMAEGGSLPSYMKEHPVFYAGPTEAPKGEPTGAFGPTTASRMDAYLPRLMELGASLVTIAKGGRSQSAIAAIGERKGLYLASIGGAAALTARQHIRESRIIDYADLGMEAVRIVVLDKLPALVAIDAIGRSFYA